MSPVARWHTQNSSRIRGACVPLPVANPHKSGASSAEMIDQRGERALLRARARWGARTCAWGPDEDGAELLRWRGRGLL
jgi:hypothetical protein